MWSASYTINVLTFGISTPVSMIVVLTNTSLSPYKKLNITFSSSVSFILPCATETFATSTSWLISRATFSILLIRLYSKKTCPPRAISRSIASLINAELYSITYVWTGNRFSGGVSITERSLIPSIDICNVLGIGVAVSVRTSTFVLICLIFSLCLTPNRCSSSTINKPKFLYTTSSVSKRCVPITISTVPFFNPANVSFCCFLVRKRLNNPIVTG